MSSFQVFIDSGAYTILNQARKGNKVAATIGLPNYCEWLEQNKGLYNVYANMDVIYNGKATYDNWIEMRKRGFDPLPVYHAGTDIMYLKKYLDAGCPYICLGAVAFLGMRYRFANFDNLWSNYLTEPNGMPRLKVHGFGLTALSVMARYPWYSVDSSSWAFIARHGGLFIARKVGGVWRFDLDHYKRNVSTRAPHKKSIPHIRMKSVVGDKLLREWLEYIETPYGVSAFRPYKEGEKLAPNESVWKKKDGAKIIPTVETVVERGVINDQQMRNEANIKFFILTVEALPPYPYPLSAKIKKQRPLF